MFFNQTIIIGNATVNVLDLLKSTRNQGFFIVAGLVILVVILAFIIKRINAIKNSRSLLKQKPRAPDLNFQEEIDQDRPSKYGIMTCSVDYTYSKSCLVISVIHVGSLMRQSKADFDCYVKVRIEPDLWNLKTCKTNICHKNNSPSFTKKFYFKIPQLELNKVTVIFEIFDHDNAGTSDQMLGRARLDISSLTQEEMTEFPIERKCPLDPPIECNDGYGEICIILKYNNINGLLRVTILEAKRLALSDEKTPPPVYISVALFIRTKLVAEKRTSVKTKTCDPFFSETFQFQLKPVKLPYGYLLIKVMKKTVFGIYKCIGKVNIGLESNSILARTHWKSMSVNPKVAIANWHMVFKNI